MATPSRSLVPLATAIHTELAAAATSTRLVDLPGGAWRRCELLVRQVRRAELRGWQLAAAKLRRELRYALGSVHTRVAELVQEIGSSLVAACPTTIHDVYLDLVALEQEFDEVTCCRQTHILSVTTEPIELAGIVLGPFEIRLHWQRLSAQSRYHVVALEPNPAASRPGVTHPHVLEEALCEGEGHLAIRQALADGRLLDFFALVASVLRTYNDESPFVALADWEGCSCNDCGTLVSDDEAYACRRCGDVVCQECEATCPGCEEAHCNGCLVECRNCQDAYCPNCMGVCGGCRRDTCAHCLEDERCSSCHENAPPESEDDRQEEPAVHADGLGQAALSA